MADPINVGHLRTCLALVKAEGTVRCRAQWDEIVQAIPAMLDRIEELEARCSSMSSAEESFALGERLADILLRIQKLEGLLLVPIEE